MRKGKTQRSSHPIIQMTNKKTKIPLSMPKDRGEDEGKCATNPDLGLDFQGPSVPKGYFGNQSQAQPMPGLAAAVAPPVKRLDKP